jgi:hypothetical protein
MKKYIVLIILFLTKLNIIVAEDIKFSASASSTTVGTGQQFSVTFSINTGGGSNFKAPSFKGFSVLSGPNQSSSSSTQIINGSFSQTVSYSYTYYLQAGNEGTYTIGPAYINVGGKTYESNPITIKVVKDNSASQNRSNQGNNQGQNQQTASFSDKDIFIRASISNASPYMGEQIIVTYKLYTSVGISQYSINKTPSNKGLWTEDLTKENERPKQYKEYIDGKQYIVAEIKKVAMFPQESGNLTIEPLEVDVIAQIPIQRRRTNTIFDFFDDPFGSSVQNIKKTIKSNSSVIRVKPLPAAGKPDDFSGAVGNFTFSSNLSKNEVKANDAINLKITVSGRGNIKLIDKFDITFPTDFETYDPKITDNINKSDNGISGTKTFDYLLIPRNQGNFTIKPIKFTYFDLNKGKYVTLTSPEYNIKVDKGDGKASATTLTTVNKEDIKYIGSDIEHIKTKPNKLKPEGQFFFLSKLYFTLLVIPVILFIAALIFRRKHLKLRGNVALLRNKKATKIARNRLKKAQKFLQNNERNNFYNEISQALWGYLSDKFNIPLAELSMESVNQSLQNKLVDTATIEQLISVLNNCEFARFTPESESVNMKKIYNEAIDIIKKIENELK